MFLLKVKSIFSRFRNKMMLGPKKIIFWVLSGFVFSGITALLIFFILVYKGYYDKIPGYWELKKIENNIASEIYSSDQKLLGKYFYQERTHTPFEEISPELIKALIATEDARFYEHEGIDYRSLLRVLFKTILFQDESSGGGSTISQQLAKNLYPRKDHGILTMAVNKTREAIIAHRLENIYSKQEILELYLNTVSFGDGIQTAAERFFSSTPADLSIQEAAVLVGMLKATHNYNPRSNPEASKMRRNIVISQMAKYNYISDHEADSIRELPVTLKYNNLDHNEGLAAYFREQLRLELHELLKGIKKDDGSSYNLYTDGLKIHTTINATLQQYAEAAMQSHMKQLQKSFYLHWGSTVPWYKDNNIFLNAIYRSERYKKLKEKGLPLEEIQKNFKQKRKMKVFTWDGEVEREMSPLDSVKHYLRFLNAGFLAMDPSDGDVLVWIGGINHKYFKYDHVNIKTKRQVGSTFKPIVYAAALENGFDPCEYIANEQKIYEEYDDWSPENSDHEYEGYYSMQGALTNSVNTISVDLLIRSGIENAVNLAHNMGIKSKIPNVPSIALGTPSISLYEMVASYCTFANKGHIITPRYLTKIENRDGKVIYENKDSGMGRKVLSSGTVEIMLEMMKGVVNSGTASRLRYQYGLFNDIAGKTGTTQNQSDGWFMGVTPNLVAGAWVGADSPGIHFRTTALGQGAATALPIWGKFMQKVNSDNKFRYISRTRFNKPSEETLAMLDCEPFVMEKEEEFFDFWDLFHKQEKDRQPRYPSQRKPEKKKEKKGFFRKLLDDIF